MIAIRLGPGCGPTGRLLRDLLRTRGLTVRTEETFAGLPDAYVCYGAGMCGNGKPLLNGNVGKFNKLTQFDVLRTAGISTLKTWLPGAAGIAAANYPLFGRRMRHREGRDILLALQPEDVGLRAAAGAEFFTEYVPRATEFRTFVYRRRHLRSYEKVLLRPQEYRFFGCSHRNGFGFRVLEEASIPREAVELASGAVQALGLDFGAVDVLKGKDGRFYVLEVNTAPGADGPAKEWINALADKITSWKRLGFPRRNGDRHE